MAILGIWRTWSRPFLAGVVALCLLIPTLDAFHCVAEFSDSTVISTSTHGAKVVIAKDVSGKPLGMVGDADPLCPHSHCHHPPGMTSIAKPTAVPTTWAYLAPPLGTHDVRPSQPPSGLLRPPRA